MENHHIQRQVFYIETGDPDRAIVIQEKIIEMARNVLPAILEKVLDQYALPQRLIRLGSVTLELGDIPEGALPVELPRRFHEAIERILREKLAGLETPGSVSDGSLSISTTRQGEEELLSYFFRTGRLPWWADHSNTVIAALLDERLRRDPQSLLQQLRRICHHPQVLPRLINQLSGMQVFTLIEQLIGREAGFIMALINKRLVEGSPSHTEFLSQRKRALVTVLAYLFALKAPFNRTDFMQYLDRAHPGRTPFADSGASVALLRILLEKGFLPPSAVETFPKDLDDLFSWLLSGPRDTLRQLLHGLPDPEAASRRIQQNVRPETFFRLIQWLAKGKSDHIRRIFASLPDLYAPLFQPLGLPRYALFKQDLQRLVLVYLLQHRTFDTPIDLASSLIGELSVAPVSARDIRSRLAAFFPHGKNVEPAEGAWAAMVSYLAKGVFPGMWREAQFEPETLLGEFLEQGKDMRQLYGQTGDLPVAIRRTVEQFSFRTLERLFRQLGGEMADLVLLLREELETQVRRKQLQLPGFSKVLHEVLLDQLIRQPGEKGFPAFRSQVEMALYSVFQKSAPAEIARLFPHVNPVAHPEELSHEAIELEVVAHYLRYGSFPLWAPEQGSLRLATEIRRLLAETPEALARLLRQLPPRPVSRLIIGQLPPELTYELIGLLSGLTADHIRLQLSASIPAERERLLAHLMAGPGFMGAAELEKWLADKEGEATAPSTHQTPPVSSQTGGQPMHARERTAPETYSDIDALQYFIERGILPADSTLQSAEALEQVLMKLLDQRSPALYALFQKASVERLIHQFSESAIKKWSLVIIPEETERIGAFIHLLELLAQYADHVMDRAELKFFIWRPVLSALKHLQSGEKNLNWRLFHEMLQYSLWDGDQLQERVNAVWSALPQEKQLRIDRGDLEELVLRPRGAELEPEDVPEDRSVAKVLEELGRRLSEADPSIAAETIRQLFTGVLEADPRQLVQWLSGSALKWDEWPRLIGILTTDLLEQLALHWQPRFAGFIQTQVKLAQLLYEQHPAVFSRIQEVKIFSWASIFSYLSGAGSHEYDLQAAVQTMVESVHQQTGLAMGAVAESMLTIAGNQARRGDGRFEPFIAPLEKELEDQRRDAPPAPEISEGKFDPQQVIDYFRGEAGAGQWSALEPLLLQAMEERPLIMYHFLWNLIGSEEYSVQLLQCFSEEAFWRLIDLMHPRERQNIYDLERKLSQLLNRQFIRTRLLLYLHDINQGGFDAETFIRRLFEQYAGTPERYLQLLESSVKFVELRQAPGEKEFLGILRKLRLTPLKTTKAAKNQRARKPEETTPSLKGAVYVPNAGIVILAPFFTRYFELLGMVHEGAFKSRELAERAVHLLQFLASGQMETPEHELVLNKVLCGVPLDQPVPAGIDLSEEEMEVSGKLLLSALGNWERMKDLSIGNFRGAFLLRAGRLEEKMAAWRLKVENKPYDLLLDTLPWGISMIKLPWMQKILNVEWR